MLKKLTTVRYCYNKCLTGMTAVWSWLLENPDVKEEPINIAVRLKLLCGGHRCNKFKKDYIFMEKLK